MMRLSVVLSVLALAGCTTKPTVYVETSRPVPDASLLSECPPIPSLPKPATMGDLLEHDDALIGLYSECAAANAAKATYIRQLTEH
jgi:hypothetical protein